jgi:hypothetical protein
MKKLVKNNVYWVGKNHWIYESFMVRSFLRIGVFV